MSTKKSMVLSVRNGLEKYKESFDAAIPNVAKKYLTPERIVKVVSLAASRNPMLAQCEIGTIIGACIDIAQLGLEPAGPMGHAYLVPYRNNKTGKTECTPIIGYKGLLEVSWRSGRLKSLAAHVIRENDEYDIELGDSPRLRHRPCLSGESGKPIAYYCVAEFVDGGKHVDYMTTAEIDRIKVRSKTSRNGPWVTDYDEMAKKTVLRRASKMWPKTNTALADALELSDRAEYEDYSPPPLPSIDAEVIEEQEDDATQEDELAAKLGGES